MSLIIILLSIIILVVSLYNNHKTNNKIDILTKRMLSCEREHDAMNRYLQWHDKKIEDNKITFKKIYFKIKMLLF